MQFSLLAFNIEWMHYMFISKKLEVLSRMAGRNANEVLLFTKSNYPKISSSDIWKVTWKMITSFLVSLHVFALNVRLFFCNSNSELTTVLRNKQIFWCGLEAFHSNWSFMISNGSSVCHCKTPLCVTQYDRQYLLSPCLFLCVSVVYLFLSLPPHPLFLFACVSQGW